jgi:hypothetical protein
MVKPPRQVRQSKSGGSPHRALACRSPPCSPTPPPVSCRSKLPGWSCGTASTPGPRTGSAKPRPSAAEPALPGVQREPSLAPDRAHRGRPDLLDQTDSWSARRAGTQQTERPCVVVLITQRRLAPLRRAGRWPERGATASRNRPAAHYETALRATVSARQTPSADGVTDRRSSGRSKRWPAVMLSERILGGDDQGIYAGPGVQRRGSVVAEDPGSAPVGGQGLAEGG